MVYTIAFSFIIAKISVETIDVYTRTTMMGPSVLILRIDKPGLVNLWNGHLWYGLPGCFSAVSTRIRQAILRHMPACLT